MYKLDYYKLDKHIIEKYKLDNHKLDKYKIEHIIKKDARTFKVLASFLLFVLLILVTIFDRI